MSVRNLTEHTCDACGHQATKELASSAPEWLAIYGDGTRIDICAKCAPTIRKALLTACALLGSISALNALRQFGKRF
jgi:hypothetical protein